MYSLREPLICPFSQTCLKHMELFQAEGTLLIPVWTSSFFLNACTRDGVQWNNFVIDWLYLPKFQGLFVKGKVCNSLFGTRFLDFDVVALRVTFRRPGLLHV